MFHLCSTVWEYCIMEGDTERPEQEPPTDADIDNEAPNDAATNDADDEALNDANDEVLNDADVDDVKKDKRKEKKRGERH